MATTIFFAGRVTSVPGSYSEVDATGLEQVGLGASGIVALLGTAEGGIPVTELETVDDFMRFTKPESPRQTFRSGDLLEGSGILFEPSNDDQILAGAQEVVAMKVNPATASVATLVNAQGDAIDLTSKDYGAFTEQINVSVADGTLQGKLLTIIFEEITESVDDLGGDAIFKLTYSEATASSGWDSMTGQINAGGELEANGTKAELGLDSDIGTQLPSSSAIDVVSTSGSDTQFITVYGLDGSGDPVSETLQLTGVISQRGSQTFSAVYGAKLSSAAVGTISVDPEGGGADVLTFAPTELVQGMVTCNAMFLANGQLQLSSSVGETGVVIVEGANTVGATVLEKVTLTGATSINTTGSWTKIAGIVLGDVAAANTVTMTGDALKSTPAVHTTVQQLADYVNARIEGGDGFTLTLETGNTSFLTDNLDVSVAAVNIDSPAEPDFTADLYAVIDWINTNSQLVTAARATGATGGAPSNTTSPIFLSGGIEGTTSFANWQAALNWLKQIRVNSVVALTGDPAVHAAVDAHCAYMGGIGRSERDGFVGLLNTGLTAVPTKAEAKTQIIDLNSRHIRACAQAVDRFNTQGVRTTFPPYFTAAVAAGMQAGSPVGTSLTFKQPNVLNFSQDTSWNPADDAEELIQAGLLFMENVEGVGRRWVRNVTTHLSSNNLAFIEGSVNEAANYSVYTFRTAMEYAVGRKGFAGTVNAAGGVAIGELGLLVDEGILVQYRSLDIELIADVLEVSVEIAPVIPINFVQSTIHLVIAS